jgi:pimeloyl-ACP methyl ester carboxylesterase
MTIRSAPDRPRTGVAAPTVRRRRPHRLRWWLAGLAALVLVVHAAGGWYFAGRIESQALAATPGTMTPAHDDVRVTAVDGDRVTLARGVDAASNFEAAASYGMAWDGGAGHIGPATVNADGTVTRTLDVVTGVAPKPGAGAAVGRAYFVADPSKELGFTLREVTVAGMPAWWIAADAPAVGSAATDTAAVFVHGQNGTRLDGLRFAEAAHRGGLPVLVISYRNDAGAPADPSGRLQYGATEWRDLDAAVAWVQAHGARRVVLAGQSMGGAVVAAFLEQSERRSVVSRIVLDCPMLSLGEVVAWGAREALPGGLAVPGTLLWSAERIASLRYGIDWGTVDYLDDTTWLDVPALVTQGSADPTVPPTVPSRLRDARPDLVTVVEFPGALHAESWNADRSRWDDAVVAFLARS